MTASMGVHCIPVADNHNFAVLDYPGYCTKKYGEFSYNMLKFSCLR